MKKKKKTPQEWEKRIKYETWNRRPLGSKKKKEEKVKNRVWNEGDIEETLMVLRQNIEY